MNIKNLQQKLKALALADTILEPEWEMRYFSYDSNWAEEQQMASMRDGEGCFWYVWFQGENIGYKSISPHDGLMSKKELDDIKNNIPKEYEEFINEPAFYIDDATEIWLLKDLKWIKYGITDITEIIDLSEIFKWSATEYKEWAEYYYEKDIDMEALNKVFDFTLDRDDILKLNPEAVIDDIFEFMKEMELLK